MLQLLKVARRAERRMSSKGSLLRKRPKARRGARRPCRTPRQPGAPSRARHRRSRAAANAARRRAAPARHPRRRPTRQAHAAPPERARPPADRRRCPPRRRRRRPQADAVRLDSLPPTPLRPGVAARGRRRRAPTARRRPHRPDRARRRCRRRRSAAPARTMAGPPCARASAAAAAANGCAGAAQARLAAAGHRREPGQARGRLARPAVGARAPRSSIGGNRMGRRGRVAAAAGAAAQAWPASLTRWEGSMPIFDSARSYFCSRSRSNSRSASAGQCSQPLAAISLSSWPARQPA